MVFGYKSNIALITNEKQAQFIFYENKLIIESMTNQKVLPKFNVFSEFHKLTDIILGTAEDFSEGEKINMAMKKYYGTKETPDKNKLINEYKEIEKILIKNKVSVYKPTPSQKIPQQLAPRDIGFVIGNTFFLSSMKKISRRKETNCIMSILKKFKGKVVKVPDNIYLEGGNVVVDNKKVFLGIGLRTSKLAIKYLAKIFNGTFEIIPIYLSEKEEIIHLDTVFNIFGENHAIIYPDGIKNSLKIFSKYEIISITKEEKDLGACNIG